MSPLTRCRPWSGAVLARSRPHQVPSSPGTALARYRLGQVPPWPGTSLARYYLGQCGGDVDRLDLFLSFRVLQRFSSKAKVRRHSSRDTKSRNYCPCAGGRADGRVVPGCRTHPEVPETDSGRGWTHRPGEPGPGVPPPPKREHFLQVPPFIPLPLRRETRVGNQGAGGSVSRPSAEPEVGSRRVGANLVRSSFCVPPFPGRRHFMSTLPWSAVSLGPSRVAEPDLKQM